MSENKRFFNNDDDDDADFGDDHDMEGEVVGFLDKEEMMEIMQLDLQQNELSQMMLDRSISLAKTNWRWYLMTTQQRLAEVSAIYRHLITIVTTEEPQQ